MATNVIVHSNIVIVISVVLKSMTLSSRYVNMHLCANRAVSVWRPEHWCHPWRVARIRRHVMLWVSVLVNLSFAYNVTCLHGCFALSSLMPACERVFVLALTSSLRRAHVCSSICSLRLSRWPQRSISHLNTTRSIGLLGWKQSFLIKSEKRSAGGQHTDWIRPIRAGGFGKCASCARSKRY